MDGQMDGYFTVPLEKICPHMETTENSDTGLSGTVNATNEGGDAK